jgi:alanine racemase
MTEVQLKAFRTLLPCLPKALASLANSAGIFHGRDYYFDLVRPGAALYGINPLVAVKNPMRQVVQLNSFVLQVRPVSSGQTIGYGATYKVAEDTRIAVIPVGYADGYPRALGGKGQVCLAGRMAPVVGRVSMDLITVDIGHLEDGVVSAGTPVELIGPLLPVDDLGRAAGTIAYEILTSLGRRYKRRYIEAQVAKDT